MLLACLFALSSAVALAGSGPVRTETLVAGPYIVDVNLYQAPYTDQPFDVTVVPHDSTLHLSGELVAEPGDGTDAVPLHAHLASLEGNTLKGTIHIPVRGAWKLGVDLSGPKGPGSANFVITVAAPGAMPTWLAWLIALAPFTGIVWWVWQQRRYRRTLLPTNAA
jgi:hypothetical protein